MTVSTDEFVYQVIRETTDILYDYGDSQSRGMYTTLEEANEAARRDLLHEYEISELEEYSETANSDGTVHVNAGTGEVDFIVKVVRRGSQSGLNAVKRDVYLVVRTETTSSGTTRERMSTTAGVYQREDSANEAAERELRKAAGITSWRDRRKFKGVFRELYDLDGFFEGAATIKAATAGGCEKEITVVVERRLLE